MWIVAIASLLTGILGLCITPFLAKVPSLNPNIIIPLVLSVCFIGAYAARRDFADVIIAVIFGVIGYLMDKYKYSRAAFVVGMVLALMIERNLHLSNSLYGEWFLFVRPIAFCMFILILVTTAWPFVRQWRQNRKNPPGESAEVESAS